MKFYYRHKKATAYLLGLLLLASFCYLTKGYSGNEEDVSNESSFSGKKDTATILTFIEEGKKGNLPAIANLFVYPIEPPIKDSAEFVQYGKIIFDDSIRQVLSETTIEDWEERGWRGFFLYNYFVESSFDDGKMTYIMYKSEEEKKLRKQYIIESFVTERYRYPDRDLPIG